MADVVLKDRVGTDVTYSGITTVGLTNTDGNQVEFYESTKLNDYYTKTQIDKLLRSSQSDYDENDAGNLSFIKNRPFYNFTNQATYTIGSSGLERIESGEEIWFKISDKPLCENSDILSFVGDSSATSLELASIFNRSISKTSVQLDTGNGKKYNLVFAVQNTIFAAAITEFSHEGQAISAWGMYNTYNEKTGDTQHLTDENLDFSMFLVFAKEGTERAFDADGKLVSFGVGTYLMFDGGTKAQITSGTITVSYGGTKKLDPSNINLSNYYTKPEVQALVTAVLPPFTAEDEGKVLGIKNGQLAWVSVASMNDELYLQQAYAVAEDGTDGIWIDGAEVQNG